MRWLPFVLLTVLVAPLLSGCTSPDADGAEARDIPEGYTFVTIYVKRPIGFDDHPIWSLDAVPQLIGFIPGANGTEQYADVARGWTEEWAEADHGPDEYPAEAVRDWVQPHTIWYEGVVPSGKYSSVRIELLRVDGTDPQGNPLQVELVGNRLSVGPGEGSHFTFEEGDEMTLVFESVIERTGSHSYSIR